jgi:hypothetical protein
LRGISRSWRVIYDLPAIVRAPRAHLERPLARGDVVLTGPPAGLGLRLSPLKRPVVALVKDRRDRDGRSPARTRQAEVRRGHN